MADGAPILTVIGCAPAWGNPGEPCSSYLVEAGGARILIDCGSGAFAALWALDPRPLDAVVLSHLRALAAKGNPSVTVVDGDVREVTASLDAVAAGIDLSAPACLLMGFLLHFFEPDAARDLVARYAAALAPGSYIVLSVGRADAEAAKAGFSTYSSGAARVYNHAVPDFASFFGSLEMVPPGVVDAREWHPGWEQVVHLRPRDGQAIVGVARVA